MTAKAKTELKDKTRVLAQIKQELVSLPLIKDLCAELGYPLSIIHGIPLDFEELDVSAKTVDSKVYLNEDLLSEPFEIIMRYAVHEVTHALQHMNREHLDHDPYADDYLDREDELAAFQNQIEYQKSAEGEDATREYVEELVDYHDLKDKDREEKIDELLNG